jgi:hypothetical protein
MGEIARLNLLSAEECAALRTEISGMREHWLARSGELPFYTLGAASYIDARADKPGYCAKAREINPLLSQRFGWLYQRLAARLSEYFAAPAVYSPELALPGYHVYLAHPVFARPIASIHCDTQYTLLDWPGTKAKDETRPMSFTLPIALPQSGGGLHTWDFHYHDLVEELANSDSKALARRIGGSSPQYFPYALGELAVHSGHILHQAAPASRMVEGDERITLQGHALACDGKWILYW